MPDISMCSGKGCPRAETCYRKTAKPSRYMQSYFVTPPFDVKQPMVCEHYWPDK